MNYSAIKQIVESKWFNNAILWSILAAGVIVGLQTYGERLGNWQDLLQNLDILILWIFTIEAALKLYVYRLDYFNDAWNIFDFVIVLTCWAAYFMPNIDAGIVAVFRLARVLRVFRLVSALPKLRIIVDAMLKSIPSMGYVGLLLFLLFYIYGVMGVFLFKENDPIRFAELGTSILTLFQITTMEGWTDILYANMHGCDHAVYGLDNCETPVAQPMAAVIYFVSFVMVGTMIVLNLFIGVIMNSMDEVQREQNLEERAINKVGAYNVMAGDVEEMQKRMAEMQENLDFIAFWLRNKQIEDNKQQEIRDKIYATKNSHQNGKEHS